MSTLNLTSRSLLLTALIWTASLVVAFQIGNGGSSESGVLKQQLEMHSAGSGSRGNASSDGGRNSRSRAFSETRRTGMTNRFLQFTRTLGGDELARLLPELVGKMSAKQVRKLLTRLEEDVDPGPARRLAKFELIARWSQIDALEAMAHVDSMSDPKGRHDLKRRAIEGWASADPTAALAYVQEADPLPDKTMQAFWSGFSNSSDLYNAFEFVTSLESDEIRSLPGEIWNVSRAVQGLFANDDRAVIAWVENLPPGDVRNGAVHGVIEQWARHDPAKAALWIEQNIDSASSRAEYNWQLFNIWQEHDPESAARWPGSSAVTPPPPDPLPTPALLRSAGSSLESSPPGSR